jgi:hypothetical protein
MGSGGHTELLDDLTAATSWTACPIADAPNQRLEAVVAGLAVIFIKRHGWNASSRISIILQNCSCRNCQNKGPVKPVRIVEVGLDVVNIAANKPATRRLIRGRI